MKKVILCLFVSLISLGGVSAQVYVGGTLNLLDHDHSGFYVHIAPEVGYNLNKQWSVAGVLAYTHLDDANQITFSPYARYSFFEKNIIRLFVDGSPELSWNDVDDDVNFGIGVMPGISVKATDHLSFVARYGFLGYRDYGDSEVKGLSLSSNSLNIGFYYTF